MESNAVIDRDACVREIATYLGWQIVEHNITPQVEGKVPPGDIPMHTNNNHAQYDLINPNGQRVASGLFASDITAVLPDWWNVTDLAFTLPLNEPHYIWSVDPPTSEYPFWDIEINEEDYTRTSAGHAKLASALCLAWLEYKRGGGR